MERMMATLKAMRDVFLRVTETGLAFVALIVLVYILLGEHSGDYVISVIANISLLIDAISPQTLIAVVLAAGLVLILKRRG